MTRFNWKPFATLAGTFLLAWLGLKYLLPLALPFVLGIALALAAEPLVGLLSRRLHFPRGLAAGIGVTMSLVCLVSLLVLLGALLIRQLRAVTLVLPQLEQTTVSSLSTLETYLLKLSGKLPTMFREPVERTVEDFFSNGTVLVDQVAQRMPALAGAAFSHVPGSALAVGTGILSSFMVSARLPQLRQRLSPIREKLQSYLPMAQKLKQSLWGWLKAQLTLSALCFFLVCTGLLILGVDYAPVWALAIALVDAIPVLGTGTILLPWSLVCLLQADTARAIGLASIYLTVTLTRSMLEPRFLSRQLGLDPLITLMALYVGFRLWGIGGMILAPMLTVIALQVTSGHPRDL